MFKQLKATFPGLSSHNLHHKLMTLNQALCSSLLQSGNVASFYPMHEIISIVGGSCATRDITMKCTREICRKPPQKREKMVKVAADTKSGSWPPASTLMQQHRQQYSCAHVVQYIPVHPKQARSPHTRPSLSPTIWHTHRTDGQVGRRRQAPVANSPSPVADLPLTGGNGYISSLGIRSLCEPAAAPQPHLTCLFPLRFLRAVVASPFNGLIQSANHFLPPGEKRSVETTVWSSPSVQKALLSRYCSGAESEIADWWDIRIKPACE